MKRNKRTLVGIIIAVVFFFFLVGLAGIFIGPLPVYGMEKKTNKEKICDEFVDKFFEVYRAELSLVSNFRRGEINVLLLDLEDNKFAMGIFFVPFGKKKGIFIWGCPLEEINEKSPLEAARKFVEFVKIKP